MSYRCITCDVHVDGPMRRFVVKRDDGQTAAELPVCGGCMKRLQSGESPSHVASNKHPRIKSRPAESVEPQYDHLPQFGE